jgi:hypothetical protein
MVIHLTCDPARVLLLLDTQQVYALMVFPSIIVALGNTIHFVIMYGAFKAAGIQPRIPFMLAWWLLQIVLPHAYIWYTNRAVSAARRAAGAGQRRVVAAAPAGAGRLGAGETKPGITLSNKLVEGAPQKGVCSGSSDDEGPSAAFCKPGKRISGDSSEIQPLATDTQQSQVPAAKVAPTKVAAAQQQVLNGKAHTPGVQDSPMEVHQAFTPTQTQPPHQQQQEAGALSHPQSLEADSDHMQLVSTDGGKEQLPAPVKPWALGPAAVKPGYALLVSAARVTTPTIRCVHLAWGMAGSQEHWLVAAGMSPLPGCHSLLWPAQHCLLVAFSSLPGAVV